VDQLTGTPPALKQVLPVAANPVYVVGVNNAGRVYALSKGGAAPGAVCGPGNGPGRAAAIETNGNTISATLAVGNCPVYGVMTGDTRRVFVMNHGDNTVTAINSVQNALDTPVSSIPVGVGPIWADLAPTLNELVVANQGNGTGPGSVTIVSIPLCSSTAQVTNPNCSATNPVDATGFGSVLANVTVGVNPIMVSVLGDGTRAYVANAGTGKLPCAAVPVAGVSEACTISVVNLTSNTVTATIPINGHPVYLATATSTPTGKVYVVCKDSQVMTVIETDTDTLDTTIPLQGFGISVRMTAQ
jgi:DNA-binding beta-propeller fold protein YncE